MSSSHDLKVKTLAEKYHHDGYYVCADHIVGYPDPENIKGYIPDIIAEKNGEFVIIEVDTAGNEDEDQTAAFQEYADENDNVRFKHITVQDG